MPQVFQSVNLGSLELKNRLIHSATFECMADENGAVTDHLVKRYVNLAKGEVGLIIPAYMYVHPRGKAFVGQTGIHDDRLISGLTHLPAAEKIKPVIGDMSLILVGGVRTLKEMGKVLSESKADFLSMSRPFIREPFLAKRLKQGGIKESSCISCNKCFAAVFNGLPLRCYADGLP